VSSLYPKIQLSEIRRIGWRHWDPIGLSDGSEFGPADCEDEYDSYLLEVVSMLCRGASRDAATNYLDSIAREHIEMPVDPGVSRSTVDALATYLAQLPEKPSIAD
jgi:hypothetical protein